MSDLALIDLPLSLDGSGVLGLAQTLGGLLKVKRVLDGLSSPHGDEAVAAEMVSRMQRDAPVLSGRLREGISYRFEDGAWVVEAEAHREGARRRGEGEGANYAPFVEYGTAPRRQVADDSYFAGAARRSGHPGTPAQAFFWQNARDVLSDYAHALSDTIDDATQEFNA